VASSQINDAKPTHTEARAVFHENAFVIRTAMQDSLAHAVNRGRFNSLIGSRGYDSRDSTHALPLYAYLATCFFPDSSCFARRISNRVPQRVKPQQLPHVTR
jgi:hypothetical protein